MPFRTRYNFSHPAPARTGMAVAAGSPADGTQSSFRYAASSARFASGTT
jgi:hypothetical protein